MEYTIDIIGIAKKKIHVIILFRTYNFKNKYNVNGLSKYIKYCSLNVIDIKKVRIYNWQISTWIKREFCYN